MHTFCALAIAVLSLQLIHVEAKILSVATEGCHMTYYDPFSAPANQFIKNLPELVCNKLSPLIVSNGTSLWIDSESKSAGGYKSKSLECCYTGFRRANPKNWPATRRIDYLIEYTTKCIPIKGVVDVKEEFVEVTCFIGPSSVYRDYHAFVVVDKKVAIKERSTEKLSVIIMGLDSVSRQNLIRQLPKTVSYLRKLGAFQLEGFNKIGDNTFPNVIGMLTGRAEEQFKQKCLPEEGMFFDKCRFMWDHFHKNGYVTAFIEDSTYNGLFLSNDNKGFRKQPTDVYGQPFMHMNEDAIGIGLKINGSRVCSGPRTTLRVLLEYSTNLILQMTRKGLPLWGYFWSSSMTHDNLNYPPNIDKLYRDMFEKFNSSNVFNNSIVVFMSDHGLRFGDYRETYAGYLEERHPFAYILVPPSMFKRYQPGILNLAANQKKLTTPYDLGATLMNLLHPKQIGKPFSYRRGTSLFSPISSQRNCLSAYVPENYCTCLESPGTPLDVSNAQVQYSAQVMVDNMNNILLRETLSCSILQLKKVLSARELNKSDPNFKSFVITLTTTPGGGIFQGYVKFNKKREIAQIVGDINRINRYSNNDCVSTKQLKLYCNCKNNFLSGITMKMSVW